MDAEREDVARELKELAALSDQFGRAFTRAISQAVRSGRSFEDTLKSIALSMSNVALKAGLKPLENAVSGTISSLAASAASSLAGSVAGSVGGSLGGGAAANAAPASSSLALPPVNVTIQASDPAAFAKSQAQVAATLARAVGRARRTL